MAKIDDRSRQNPAYRVGRTDFFDIKPSRFFRDGFVLCFFRRRARSACKSPSKKNEKLLLFFPSPQAQKPCTIKNVLRFELHLRLCFGKTDGAEKPHLELLRGFRDSSRIAFFGTFFSKKKVHKDKEMRLKISQRRARGNEHSFSHDFVVPAPSKREPQKPLLGEACKGASHRLQISLKEGDRYLPSPQAQPATHNIINPARSAPFSLHF